MAENDRFREAVERALSWMETYDPAAVEAIRERIEHEMKREPPSADAGETDEGSQAPLGLGATPPYLRDL